jgi:hypothetical protein
MAEDRKNIKYQEDFHDKTINKIRHAQLDWASFILSGLVILSLSKDFR